MDIGLYNLKYPARRLIAGILPFFANISPNQISWSIMPIGLLTALVYYLAPQESPFLYLVGILLILVRMFLATLDGLVATHYKKQSSHGELINRVIPELCDTFYLTAITLSGASTLYYGVAALAMAWLTTFSGLIGTIVGKPIQSVGPVGQTDRLFALLIGSLGAFGSAIFNWQINFMKIFLMWTILGGVITISLRLYRIFK